MPKKVSFSAKAKKFDIDAKFSAINNVSLIDFIDVETVIFAAALANAAFVGRYFRKAKEQGIDLPSDTVIKLVIDQFAGSTTQIKEMYKQYKQPNRKS